MKNQNNILMVTLVALAFAFAPFIQAGPCVDGGPTHLRRATDAPSLEGGPDNIRPRPAARARGTAARRPDTAAVNRAANEDSSADSEESSASSASADDALMPVVSIHAVDNVTRGETGTFVLDMKPALMLGGMYVKFSIGGTAAEGIDYVATVSPAYIGKSGYGLIQIKTLPDRRGMAIRQAYSVVITLENAGGYSLGKPSSATMWIKP
jgi:hypothetical protein